MAQTAIVVPCRLESSRFPRKLLHNIRGKPLVHWVAERIAREAPEYPLYFAVDDELLYESLSGAGFQAVRTRANHPSGTDRIAEANRRIRAAFIINVQADEPLVTARQIRLLADLISRDAEIATLASPFATAADFLNPNQVKVVCDKRGRALYFSRSPIPHGREAGGRVDDEWVRSNACYRHLGLYAYKASFLERFAGLPPGHLEQIEKLEQLRALENGCEIACGITDDPTIGVDTLEDAAKFEEWLKTSI
jgi:3-deoxy-manno-octulosonate cytidylyltransferase (CMP-KDO synthetase)